MPHPNNPYTESLAVANTLFRAAAAALEASLKKPLTTQISIDAHEMRVSLYHGAETWLAHVTKLHEAFEAGTLYVDPSILSPQDMYNLLEAEAEAATDDPLPPLYPREWTEPQLRLLNAARSRYQRAEINEFPEESR